MCSKTQWAVFGERTAWRTSRPRSLSETISPGWTSRISLAPMMSNAQLSEATTMAAVLESRRGTAAGRPCGSRKATTASVVITTVE